MAALHAHTHTDIHNVNPHQRTTLYLCPKICSALTHFFTLRMHHLTHTHYCLSFCLTVLASLCAGTTSTSTIIAAAVDGGIIAAAVGAAVVCIAVITVTVVCVVLAKSKNKTMTPAPARNTRESQPAVGRMATPMAVAAVQTSNDIPMASATMIHQPVATVNAAVVAPSAGHLDIPVAYGQTQPAVQSEVIPVAYPLKM